jgi:Pyridoxamine 5'-phosphate oxidase
MRIIRDRPGTVDIDEFLGRPLFAHLATVAEQGPRESPVWFLWEAETVWIIGSRTSDRFPQRIAEQPRCALGIVDFEPVSGLVQHVGMRGHATIEPFDVQRARRLLRRYLGDDEPAWDPRFRKTLTNPADEDNVLVRLKPETLVARDVSYTPAPRGLGAGGRTGSSRRTS